MYLRLPSPSSRISFLPVLLTLAVTLSYPSASSAFCPVPEIRANGEFFKSDAVFAGTVVAIRKTPDTDHDFGGWFYRLQVEEIFRGSIVNELTVYTEDSDIRFPLEKGRKYLLFAYKRRGRLEIDGCGNSDSFANATEALRILNALRKGVQPTEIEGWIAAETSGIDVSGILVTVQGGSKSYTAVTDKDGWFHFLAPPGRYHLDFSSKEYYLNGGDDFWYKPEGFVLHPGECASLEAVSVRHLSK
ncbi:MAG: hypothetical protein ABSH39_09075 [Candidatus Acidiferrum sp.]